MGEPPLQLRRLKNADAAKSTSTENHPAAKVFEPHWTTRRGKYNEHTFPIYNKVTNFFDKHQNIKANLGKSTNSIVTSVEKECVVDISASKGYSKKLNPETVAALGREKSTYIETTCRFSQMLQKRQMAKLQPLFAFQN